MAKSIVLYGILLGTIICFCSNISRPGVNGVHTARYESISTLSGTKWSRKISSFGINDNLIRNKIQQIYSAEIGVREKTGKNDGRRVEEYLAITQLGSGYAWCAAFVSWVFAEAGFLQPRTPWSPSLFPKDRVIWERGRSLLASNNTHALTPKPADVFGIYFVNLKRIAHVGFVDVWGEKYVITVEGVRP